MERILPLLVLALSLCGTGFRLAAAEDRNAIVRSDRESILDAGFWIYNDLKQGFAEAEATGKPMLVVFRCVP